MNEKSRSISRRAFFTAAALTGALAATPAFANYGGGGDEVAAAETDDMTAADEAVSLTSDALAVVNQSYRYYSVLVSKGYLALRSAPSYDPRNEGGKLYTGDTVMVLDTSNPTYWFVWVPSLDATGYVNRHYLVGGDYYYTVSVAKGYLALRTAKVYDSSNEIGALYTGDVVYVLDTSDELYWYVYSPTLRAAGFVNKRYLVGGQYVGEDYIVSVASGYLALRSAPSYDEANELAALYSGDVVQLRGTASGTYWWVYAPNFGLSGYVNSNYLVAASSPIYGVTYTVSVANGYLALRTEMEYDESNEIGALYNGDIVYLQTKSSGKYWYVYAPSLDAYGFVNASYLQ